jgi:hypothetical protein
VSAALLCYQAIDHTAHVLSLQYNKEFPAIFNTYQAYLKGSYTRLQEDVERARRERYIFAAKLVSQITSSAGCMGVCWQLVGLLWLTTTLHQSSTRPASQLRPMLARTSTHDQSPQFYSESERAAVDRCAGALLHMATCGAAQQGFTADQLVLKCLSTCLFVLLPTCLASVGCL